MATLPTEKQSISTINLTIPSPSCTPIPSHNNPSTALLPIVPKTTTTITSHPCTSPSPPNPLRRDLILGFSDGLTVPFALCAGLSSLGNSRLVILAGLAELFSGAISMGLGAYLAAFSEQRHTSSAAAMSSAAEEAEEETTDTWMQSASAETQNYAVVKAEQQQQQQQQHGYSAWLEGLVMGLSYFIGGLLPMIPYFCLASVHTALYISIGLTVAILLIFGYGKAALAADATGSGAVGKRAKKRECCVSAAHTLLVGVVAAGASYGIVRGVGSARPV